MAVGVEFNTNIRNLEIKKLIDFLERNIQWGDSGGVVVGITRVYRDINREILKRIKMVADSGYSNCGCHQNLEREIKNKWKASRRRVWSSRRNDWKFKRE